MLILFPRHWQVSKYIEEGVIIIIIKSRKHIISTANRSVDLHTVLKIISVGFLNSAVQNLVLVSYLLWALVQ